MFIFGQVESSIWEYSILAGVLISIFGIVSLWLIKFKLPSEAESEKRTQDRQDRLASVQEEFTRNVSSAVQRMDTAISQIATATEGTTQAVVSMDQTSALIRKDLAAMNKRLESVDNRLTVIEKKVE